jgi:hypothetical protein
MFSIPLEILVKSPAWMHYAPEKCIQYGCFEVLSNAFRRGFPIQVKRSLDNGPPRPGKTGRGAGFTGARRECILEPVFTA